MFAIPFNAFDKATLFSHFNLVTCVCVFFFTMDVDSKFKHLIAPIQDLAQNWDIDIAESLSEYLDELEHLQVKFGQNEKSLNFAEAALLIQGSTAVYSRKVEYLHRLVLQALEQFNTNQTVCILPVLQLLN